MYENFLVTTFEETSFRKLLITYTNNFKIIKNYLIMLLFFADSNQRMNNFYLIFSKYQILVEYKSFNYQLGQIH